jgi:hypothetical protein
VRTIRHRYLDPLDQIWLGTAGRLGLRIERTYDVYASTDGRGALRLGMPDTLDPDDCLAQMIFHELCHALIEGPTAFAKPDWGLDNTSARDVAREHACLRLQSTLAAEYGLRRVFAPTTDFRDFFDGLPADPLEQKNLASVTMAILGLQRVDRPPWAPFLREALSASAAVAGAASAFVVSATAPGPGREQPRDDGAFALPALWRAVEGAPERHPTGFATSPGAADRSCGTCCWFYRGGRGLPVARCRQADGARVESEWSACVRWEGALDCQTCGACCREAYHSVTVSRRDPVIRQHPELIVKRDGYVELARVPTDSGTRCAALGGDGCDTLYSCAIYEQRPTPCRELSRGGTHCLTARRRVGVSR